MLIYDHNKEFVGIDEDDLRLLGYASAQELFSDCSDIADLFVKKPGYIHNFKNFQWIDFILHAEAETSKVIIQAKTRSFACDLAIKPFFLTNAPGEEAYAILLQHVKPLGSSEEAEIAQAPAAAATAVAAPTMQPKPLQPTTAAAVASITSPEPSAAEEPAEELPSFDDVSMTALSEPDTLDVPETGEAVHDPYAETEDIFPDFNTPLEIEEDVFMTEEEEPAQLQEDIFETVSAPIAEEPTFAEEATLPGEIISESEQAFLQNLQTPSDYVFDPNVAADELGLPVDLIEEFIGDFIQQSHDFHDELFEAVAKSDFENVKILSHKLKGVAANLRIEDAFEVLSIINNSHDHTEVEASIKHFYQIIGKLEGKEEAAPAAVSTSAAEAAGEELPPMPASTEEDVYAFDLIQSDKTEEPPAEEPKGDENADDLYNFDIAAAPAPDNEPTETDTSDDLYNIDITAEPVPDSESTGAEASDDLYNFDIAAQPSAEDNSIGEDLYKIPEEEPARGVDEAPRDAAPALLHYDVLQAANELGLRVEIVQDLQNDFVADARERKSNFEEAVTMSQSELWQSYASNLKGVTDNLRMSEISATLEKLTHTDDVEEARNTVHQLYSYIDQL